MNGKQYNHSYEKRDEAGETPSMNYMPFCNCGQEGIYGTTSYPAAFTEGINCAHPGHEHNESVLASYNKLPEQYV